MLRFCWTISVAISSTYFLYFLFFLFKLFFFLFSKKKKKILINPHLLLHFSVTPPSFFSLFYILTPLLLILFCIKFDIISIIQSIFFSHKTMSTLSLLSFDVFLFIFITLFFMGFFLITLIKIDFFFFKNVFGIVFFNFPSQRPLSLL